MRLSTLLSAFVLIVAPTFVACDDDDKTTDTVSDTSTPDTSGDTVSDTTTPDTTPDTTNDVPTDACGVDTLCGDTTPADTADTEDTSTPEVEVSEPTKVDAACSEAGYSECFINDDCQASERCENMSANDVEIPCCVTGARGTKVAGEACTSENECDTSLCISYNDGPQLCSKPCDGSGTDCPAAAAECVFGLCVPGE